MVFSWFVSNRKSYGTNNPAVKLILLPLSSEVHFCVLSTFLKHLCLGRCSFFLGVNVNFISFIAFG